MELAKAVEQLYPDIDFTNQVIILDKSGLEFIEYWGHPSPEPTQAQLDQAWEDWQAGADDRLWVELRIERDKKLRGSDWTQISDVPMMAEEKEKWIIYRQKLRDIPQDFQNPGDVVFPTKPNS